LNRAYPANKIITTKYTPYNFLFKNLLTQFSKAANLYFLLITFLQCIPAISISGGKPAMLPPLLLVVLVSMVKDAFEDYKRSLNDKRENETAVECYNPATKRFESV